TGALGGGARHVDKIARAIYDELYADLSVKKQRRIRRIQMTELKWRYDHEMLRVYSTNCRTTVSLKVPIDATPNDDELICAPCMSVLKEKGFKNTLRVPLKNENNLIYTNQIYLHEGLVQYYARVKGLQGIFQAQKPLVHYVSGVLDGSIENDVFSGLLDALAKEHDKIIRGVGMQNFQYLPAYDEFLHI
ncbi:hypothetical protein K474DRAFT_1579795, partial [Panus rudis PR-1116 ss-1]